MIEFPPGTTGHRHAMSDLNDPPDWLRSHIKALNEPVVRIGPVQVAIREATDSAAKTLSQEIYRRFGFLDAQVPFFDGKGQFKLHD